MDSRAEKCCQKRDGESRNLQRKDFRAGGRGGLGNPEYDRGAAFRGMDAL